jgi:alkane 1-monooxygenase
MTTAAQSLPASRLPAREILWIWLRQLTSLYIPLLALGFLWTGPHRWYVAALWLAPLFLAHQLDCAARFERRQPTQGLPARPFDALVYLLAALQIWVIVELVRLFAAGQGFFSLDMAMAFLLVGGSSGFSIITAHELIHRRNRFEQGLGRLLLCSVLYEHFFTEHLRGHHVLVGRPEDPATARFGESYEDFFRRTLPAQLRSAWRLEKRRLGDPEMKLLDRRMLRHRVLHGLVLEWGLALAILAAFGFAAFAAFVLQAFAAVRLLEAVNYFEHWGLVRAGARVEPVDSWDTHSWFTYYGLVGLSRHADHHAAPARPYQQLRVREEAPILPSGYVGMVDQVMGRNDEFQQMAAEELGRRRLGPFASEPEPASAEAARERLRLAQASLAASAATREPSRLARAWRSLALPARRALVFAGVVALTALGAHLEAGGSALAARLALHAWILGVFVAVVAGARLAVARGTSRNLAWTGAFAALLLLGLATDLLRSLA